MYYFKKYLAVGCSAVFLATAITSCSSSNSTTDVSSTSPASTTTAPQASSDANSDSTASTKEYGKVTAVDGNTITIALGEMSGGGNRGDKPSNDGATPSGTPDGQAPSGDAVPPFGAPDEQAPSGEAVYPSGTPDGQAPSDDSTSASDRSAGRGNSKGQGGMGGFGGFSETGETKTITITDESILKSMGAGESSEVSLSSITTGTILAIEYDTDGTMTSIMVMNMQKGNNATSTPSASSNVSS